MMFREVFCDWLKSYTLSKHFDSENITIRLPMGQNVVTCCIDFIEIIIEECKRLNLKLVIQEIDPWSLDYSTNFALTEEIGPHDGYVLELKKFLSSEIKKPNILQAFQDSVVDYKVYKMKAELSEILLGKADIIFTNYVFSDYSELNPYEDIYLASKGINLNAEQKEKIMSRWEIPNFRYTEMSEDKIAGILANSLESELYDGGLFLWEDYSEGGYFPKSDFFNFKFVNEIEYMRYFSDSKASIRVYRFAETQRHSA
jgi:hypothetical protein